MAVMVAPARLPALVRTPDRQFGVYVHVPFCATRCGYCDFNTYTPAELGGANPDGWLAAVRAGVRGGLRWAAERLGPAPADTVFVGGGTPSLLGADRLANVLVAIRDTFRLASGAEGTTEATPQTPAPDLFVG